MADEGVRLRRPATLGSDVRARRKDLGLSQQELADLSDTSARFIGALEGGKPSVRLDKVTAVLDALGLELRASLRGLNQSTRP